MKSAFRCHRTLGGAVVVSLLAIFVMPSAVRAHLMNAWSYEEMFAKADLVAIAKPISTQDTKERSRLSGPGDVVPTVGMVTEFDSRLILKGDKKTKHFILHHYRLAESNIAIVNGPSLVAFDSKEPASYLLFLVREPDGRYAPVGGQDDPGLFSVLKLGGMAD